MTQEPKTWSPVRGVGVGSVAALLIACGTAFGQLSDPAKDAPQPELKASGATSAQPPLTGGVSASSTASPASATPAGTIESRNLGGSDRPGIDRTRRQLGDARRGQVPPELRQRQLDGLFAHLERMTRVQQIADAQMAAAGFLPATRDEGGDQLSGQGFLPLAEFGIDLTFRPIGPPPEFPVVLTPTFQSKTRVADAFPGTPSVIYYRILDTELLAVALIEGEESDVPAIANPLGIVDPEAEPDPDTGELEPLDEDGFADFFPPAPPDFITELDLIPPNPQTEENGFEFIDLLAAEWDDLGFGGGVPLNIRPAFFDPDGQAVFLHEQFFPFLIGAGEPDPLTGWILDGFSGANIPSPEVNAAIFRAFEIIERAANVVFVERFPFELIPEDPEAFPFFPSGNPFDPTGPLLDVTGDSEFIPEDDYPWLLFMQTGDGIPGPITTGSLLTRIPIPSGVASFARDDLNFDGIPDVASVDSVFDLSLFNIGALPALPGTAGPVADVAVGNTNGNPFPNLSGFGPEIVVATGASLFQYPNNNFGTFTAPVGLPGSGSLVATGVLDGAAEQAFGVVAVSGTGLTVLVPDFLPPPFVTGTQRTFGGLQLPGLDTGGVTPSLGGPASDLELADINGDGFLDIVTASTSATADLSFIFNDAQPPVNIPSGGGFGIVEVEESNPFDEPTVPGITDVPAFNVAGASGFTEIVVQDLNGDGSPDIAAINPASNLVSVLLNDGTSGAVPFSTTPATFALPVGAVPVDLIAINVSGSALPELVVLTNGPGADQVSLEVFANTSTPTTANFAGSTVTPQFASNDIDGDGIAIASGDVSTLPGPEIVLLIQPPDPAIDPNLFIFQITGGTIAEAPAGGFASAGENATAVTVAELSGSFPAEIIVNNAAGTVLFITGSLPSGEAEIRLSDPGLRTAPLGPDTETPGTPPSVTLAPTDPANATGLQQIFIPGLDLGLDDSDTFIDIDLDGLPDIRDDFATVPMSDLISAGVIASPPPGLTASTEVSGINDLPIRATVVGNSPFADGIPDEGSDLNSTLAFTLDTALPASPVVLTIPGDSGSPDPTAPGALPPNNGFNVTFNRPARRGDLIADIGAETEVGPTRFTNDAIDLDGDGIVDIVENPDNLPDPSLISYFVGTARDLPDPIVSIVVDAEVNPTASALAQTLFAMGFIAEQQRPGRDNFIQVLFENLVAEEREEFIELVALNPLFDPSLVGLLATEEGRPPDGSDPSDPAFFGFDFDSVTLEDPFVVSNGRGPAWLPLPQFADLFDPDLGIRDDLSQGDVTTLQATYGPAVDLLGNPIDAFAWFYGRDPQCPADVDGNGIQDANDITAYRELWLAGVFNADVPPIDPATGLPLDGPTFGGDNVINLEDVINFFQGLSVTGLGPCVGAGTPGSPATQQLFRNRSLTPGSAPKLGGSAEAPTLSPDQRTGGTDTIERGGSGSSGGSTGGRQQGLQPGG